MSAARTLDVVETKGSGTVRAGWGWFARVAEVMP